MAIPQRTLSKQASADLRYFGSGSRETDAALWFKPERLLAADFEPDAYVADLRRFVPLETVSQELEHYLGTLKSKLVEVINEDYNDFVSLTTKLVNVDGAVKRMWGPLQEVSEKLAGVQGNLQQELEALQEGLRLRKETATARALLELMQDTAHTMSKVESLLAEVEAADEQEAGLSGEILDNRCRMLERLASEVSRLSFYAAKGKDLQFVQNLETRMDAAKQKLQFRLSAALKAALVNKEALARQHCFLAYASVSDAAGAEKAVQDAVVRPLVMQILEQHSTTGPRSAEAFPQILDSILEGVQAELQPLIEGSQGSESGLQSFDFLGNSLLAEVDRAMAEKLSGAVSPGVPATFLANYNAAIGFLEGLERLCPTQGMLLAFRSSSHYGSFTRRWKLSIYFSTRFQEIAGELEGAISAEGQPTGSSAASETLSLSLGPSAALVECLRRVSSAEVFLQPVADKFSRLVLQLLARYTSWLKTSFGRDGAETSPQTMEGANEQGAEGLAQGVSVELLASGRADVDALSGWLRSDYRPAFVSLLSFLPAQASEAVDAALENAIVSMHAQAEPFALAIVAQLADKCAAGLTQLRGITAMYRMSARPSPSRPSHYVGGILASLGQFLETSSGRSLGQTARQQIAEGIVADIAQRFRKMSSELLETLRKTESSLKRIRQSRATEAAAGGGPSDIDKISLQLFLDVQEFGRQAAKFGVTPASLPAYQQLWKAVAPPDQSDNIQI